METSQNRTSKEISEKRASQGTKLGVMRYVLGFSFGLAVVSLVIIYMIMD